MSIYFFNADYEESLVNNKNTIHHSHFNQELEHLFWWVSDETLLSTRKYSSAYFNYIQKYNRRCPKIVNQTKDKIEFFWGPLVDLEQEKKLNSKETSFNIAKKLNINHPSAKIVLNESEIILNTDYIYKTFFGLSGKGHITGDDEKRIKKELKILPLIFEKKLKRISDFSYLRLVDKGVFYQTVVDKKFHYKGTMFLKDFNWQGQDISFGAYLSKIESINQILMENLAQMPWSIDGFFFDEDNMIKTMVMCEINVRKTMGYIAYLLSEFFCKEYSCCAFFMHQKSDISLKNAEFFLRLSPDDNKFHTYLVATNDQKLLVDFFDRI